MACSQTLLSQINDDYLTCQICMEPYQSPKVLTCQHSFCMKCLESCEKTAQGSYILCPLCRQRTVLGLKGVEGLKNNFVLSNIIAMLVEWRKTHIRDEIEDNFEMCQTCPTNEATMATYQCIECLDHLCADCAAFHSRTKLTKHHEVVPLQEIESGKHKEKIHCQEMSRCNAHETLNVEQFCTDCDLLACRDCIIETHQGHPLVPLDDAIKQIKQEVEVIQGEMEVGAEASRKSLEDLMKVDEEERFELAQVEQDIETLANDFIAAIKEKRANMLKEIEEIQSKKLSNLSSAKDHLEMQLNCMLNCTQLSSCVLQDGTVSEMLSLRKKMSQTMKELKETAGNADEKYKDNVAHDQSIRFIPGNITGNSTRGMGIVEKKKSNKTKFVKLNVFANSSDDKKLKQIMPKARPVHSPKLKHHQLIVENPMFDTEQCCSSKPQQVPFANEELFVDLPDETVDVKVLPVPIPRKKINSAKNSPTSSPAKPPLPGAKPAKPTVTVKPHIVEPPECYKITRIKGTVPIPVKPVKPINKVLPNHYPTAPHRIRHDIKPQPSSPEDFSYETADQPCTTNGKCERQKALMPNKLRSPNLPEKVMHESKSPPATMVVKPMAYRIAPEPPAKPNKVKIIPLQGYNTIAGTKVRSHKKLPAPLPPTTPTQSLKADILRVFGTKGQGYRDFQGPPHGVAMTNDKMLVLDGEGQQVIIFNIDGFYSSRFKVNIPNQGKLKPCGLTVSPSNQVYVLFQNIVTVWSLEGTLVTLFGHNELTDAHGITVDSQERVIVADQGKHVIIIFSKRGNKLLEFGSYGNNDIQFQCPRYVCVTSRDEIIVSDHHNHTVKIFNRNGKFLAKCGPQGQIKYPESVTTVWPKKGQAEVILVADEGNNRVSAFDLRGRFMYHILEKTDDLGLKSPQCIATSSDGKLVIFQTNSIQGRIYDLHTVINLV